jgi:hypothetical protein
MFGRILLATGAVWSTESGRDSLQSDEPDHLGPARRTDSGSSKAPMCRSLEGEGWLISERTLMVDWGGTHRETPMLTCLELRTVITQIAAI